MKDSTTHRAVSMVMIQTEVLGSNEEDAVSATYIEPSINALALQTKWGFPQHICCMFIGGFIVYFDRYRQVVGILVESNDLNLYV